MNEQTPSLPQFREDGQTLKSEALADAPITIVDSMEVIRRDGTIGYKWVVRHLDQTLGIYWAPGMAPPQQVKQWFRLYPGRELHAVLRRKDVGGAVAHWVLEQRTPAADATAPSPNGFERELVDQVPF